MKQQKILQLDNSLSKKEENVGLNTQQSLKLLVEIFLVKAESRNAACREHKQRVNCI